MGAKRYNTGKLRYDLLPPGALKHVVDVYTKGAHKYTIYEDDNGKTYSGAEHTLEEVKGFKIIDDGANNWRKGQDWVSMMASIQRHIEAWRAGEDMDKELGTYHLSNAVWGLLGLLEYYNIHPELDNRFMNTVPNIGLDIDGVLADFSGHYLRFKGYPTHEPIHWNDPRFKDWKEIIDNKEFMLGIPPLIKPEDLAFEPYCYITARATHQDWTQEWLNKNGFPFKPLITVPPGESKVAAAQSVPGLERFIDDNYDNFKSLNSAGIPTYLLSRPMNEKYNVGFKRINNINEILKK